MGYVLAAAFFLVAALYARQAVHSLLALAVFVVFALGGVWWLMLAPL